MRCYLRSGTMHVGLNFRSLAIFLDGRLGPRRSKASLVTLIYFMNNPRSLYIYSHRLCIRGLCFRFSKRRHTFIFMSFGIPKCRNWAPQHLNLSQALSAHSLACVVSQQNSTTNEERISTTSWKYPDNLKHFAVFQPDDL